MRHLDKIERKKDTYVAYGHFDGVHKGHLAVIEELVKRGKADRKETVVLSLCNKEIAMNGVLTTEEEKAFYIEKTGVDYLISYEGEFSNTILFETLGATLIVTSKGNPELENLQKAANAAGCEVYIIDNVLYQEEIVTSQLIRSYFMDCKFQEVTKMCGHAYLMIGEVVHGKALGRTVGMPTANLGVLDTKLKPPSGVYATRTTMEGEHFQGLTNIGTRPSVDSLPIITIETFLLDFAKDIYGKKLFMEVHLYIRGVQKFDSLEEVQSQVQKDLEQVKGYI